MRADAVWGLLLAAATAVLLVIAYQPREVTIFSRADNMFWPRHVLWPLLLFSLVLAGQALVRARHQSPKEPLTLDIRPLAKPFLLAFGCGAGLLLVDVIGFVPVTFLFSAVTLMFLGRLAPKITVMFATIVTLVVWGIFLRGLAVPLPRGIGPFRELSFLLY